MKILYYVDLFHTALCSLTIFERCLLAGVAIALIAALKYDGWMRTPEQV